MNMTIEPAVIVDVDVAENPRAATRRQRVTNRVLAGKSFRSMSVRVPRHVYFVTAPNGLMKIGSSIDIDLRFDELQSMSPVPLKLVAYIERGGTELERKLHRLLAPYRSHGEWFRVELSTVQRALDVAYGVVS